MEKMAYKLLTNCDTDITTRTV